MVDKYVVGKLSSIAINAISRLDKDEREASIFAILCMLKMACPDEFEAAFIAFLRHGSEAISAYGKGGDNAED